MIDSQNIVGTNNEIMCDKKSFSSLGIKINGDSNLIYLGNSLDNSRRNCTININGHDNKVHISDYTSMYGLSISVVGNNNNIFIGKFTFFNNHCEIFCASGTNITIGEDCMFSKRILIYTSDIYTLYDIRSNEPINIPSNIDIGNHVWVCEGCDIQKGTKICDCSIVGAYSIVKQQFTESNILIAGQPAKILKKNVNWDKKVHI